MAASSKDDSAALVELAAARVGLAFDPTGVVDTRSSKGCAAAEQFLGALEAVATALQLEPVSRAYRQNFQAHFAELQLQRDYSVAVLEACLSLARSGAIWANGQKFELSQDADAACSALLDEWDKLLIQLDHLLPPALEAGLSHAEPQLGELLSGLDSKWAAFEHCYILEIVRVQDEAKGLVVRAIEIEALLARQEEGEGEDDDLLHALVACISQLNAAANLHRKSDELSPDILENSTALLRMCELDPESPLQAVQVLANQVVHSFEEVRQCLRDLQLDDLNPQLCHNEELVNSLVQWEDAWITGARYVQTRPVLAALCKLVPVLLRAMQSSTRFEQMCQNFEAELFLVLPRIVWLTYFEHPECLLGLISNLLPHRFVQVPVYSELPRRIQRMRRHRSEPALGEAEPDLAVNADASLRSIQLKFNAVKMLLEGAFQGKGLERERAISDMLVQAAVGTEEQLAAPRAVGSLEELMRQLESWSMELQRHSAEDWNECINVLVRCLLFQRAQEGL